MTSFGRLSDAELRRRAYGRPSTTAERDDAERAALELARRAAASTASDEVPDDEPGATAPAATHDDEPADALTAAPPERWARHQHALRLVALGLIVLVAVGLSARALAPRPSLEAFDRPASEREQQIALELESFDADAIVRIVAEDGRSIFFATLSSRAADAQLCVGIAEFGAITIVECVPLAQFEVDGIAASIPLSSETGGIRIGEGYAFTWGPTGPFHLERLPSAG